MSMEAILRAIFMSLIIGTGVGVLQGPVRDLFASTYIWTVNRIKGKPKFVVGTRFAGIVQDNGYRHPACTITGKDFFNVYVAFDDHTTAPIKKRHLKGWQKILATNRCGRDPG